MPARSHGAPNPRRVAAGRRNRRKRKGLTEAGRQRLREAALRNKPWLKSTGPRTAAGKAKVSRILQQRHGSPELRRELAGLNRVIEQLAEIRREMNRDVGELPT